MHVFVSLTLENIMVCDPQDLGALKITDFGLSTQLDSQRSVTLQCGTLIYMAPEILFRYTYTKSVDIYSCSVIMYLLFSRNQHPLYTPKMTADDYKKKIAHSKFPGLGPEYALADNFLQRISKYEALERYNVVEALKHPWITRRLDDQVPLSIYESFMSFENMQKILLVLRLAFIVYSHNEQAEVRPAYDPAYLDRVRRYNEASLAEKHRRNADRREHKKKVTSAEHIKELFGEIDSRKQRGKQQVDHEIYNDKHPKIEKLNSMFSNLFEKKAKNHENSVKIETMGNLASFEEALPSVKPENPNADGELCKEKIEQQIEKYSARNLDQSGTSRTR